MFWSEHRKGALAHHVRLSLIHISIPEDLDYQGLLDDLFKEYTTASVMSRVRTTDLGSLYEVMYNIKTVSYTHLDVYKRQTIH